MSRDYQKYEIDGERLKKAIELTGTSLSQASISIGRNADYLRACISAGAVNMPTERAIEAILGIPLGMYLSAKPETPKQGKLEGLETPEGLSWMTYDALNKCVFNAVYGAINKASIDGII